MHIDRFDFGSVQIDGVTYSHDVVIDRGTISERRKKPSKKFRDRFGHTPLSGEETIPWDCRRLVVGTGAGGSLPVMNGLRKEASARGVALLVLPTKDAVRTLNKDSKGTNAILHVTC